MMPTLRLAACLALAALALPAAAQEPAAEPAPAAAPVATAAPAAAKGDAGAGELKVYTCSGCHGIPGYKNIYPHYNVPKIVGQNYNYLVAALTEYQKGERAHPTMRAQAESFTAQDIADIAAYLSTHKAGDHK